MENKQLKDNTFEYVNHLFKDKDCQHCGDEWEYQCYECEKAEKEQEEVNKC